MGFFNDPGDGPEEQLDASQIPDDAARRLGELGDLFTSTLSVGEFALLSKLGPTPLAQVLGASVYQVGWQYLPADAQWGGEVFCSLNRVAHAWDEARRRAFDRLAEEAKLVGADAVVGVQLRRGEHDWARGTVDYVVSGTGIRTGSPAETPPRPMLSDLSVQEYWKLRSGGWEPAGLVASTAVMFVSQSTGRRWRRRMTAARNQELTEFTRGFTAARHTAVRSLAGQAQAARGDGIVGVTLDHRVTRDKVKVGIAARRGYSQFGSQYGIQQSTGREERSGITVTIQAVGTAIRRSASAGAGFAPAAVMRLGAPA